DRSLTRFTLSDLFADATVRKHAFVAFVMSPVTTLAWWGISTWVAPFVAAAAAKAQLPPQTWAAYAGMSYNFGAILGYIGLGFLSDLIGRKPVVMTFFAGALVLTPVFYMWTTDLHLLVLVAGINGFFTLGLYSWMPVWLPELFPTRMRATGMAFAFNAPRFVAFLGPLVAGTLIASFGGFGYAATIVSLIYILGLVAVWFLPETNGRPLPT